MKAAPARVVILDYGSQYTQLIARRVRELGYYSVLLPAGVPWSRIAELEPRALILSGGPQSVYEKNALTLPENLIAHQTAGGFPILGICYGMQLLARELGGKVEPSGVREYGKAAVRVEHASRLLGERGSSRQVWMSHGDSVTVAPEGFVISAKSENGGIAAMEPLEGDGSGGAGRAVRPWIGGLQFHPEVAHTDQGIEILRSFIQDIAGLKPDWTMSSVIEEQIERIRAKVGPTDHVICALSGGVDSTVAAVLVHKAIGPRLHCVFVDTGMLRYQEHDRVMQMFQGALNLPVERESAGPRFLGALAGVTDPEAKRKIIGREFIAVFDSAAEGLAKKLGRRPKFLVQGTLYPDVIESAPRDGQAALTHAATIKSHHNVGGLPKDLKFELIEPLRDLFKDEVRKLGRELGIPAEFLMRHPFPGPGLGVRIIGEVTPSRVDTLQRADEIFIQEIKAAGVYDKIWQAFAVFLPIKTVGVQGDGRTHAHVIALRAVHSTDGMTADWFFLDGALLGRVSSRICNEVQGVNRVVYDVTSKPPATIEWE